MFPIKPLVELRRLAIAQFQPTTHLSLLNLWTPKAVRGNLANANRSVHIWILNWENFEWMLHWDLGMKGKGSICTVFPPALSGNWQGTFFIAVAQCQKMNLVRVLIKSHHSVIRLLGKHGRFPTAGRLFLWISEFLQNSLCPVQSYCPDSEEKTKTHNRKWKHKTNPVKMIWCYLWIHYFNK